MPKYKDQDGNPVEVKGKWAYLDDLTILITEGVRTGIIIEIPDPKPVRQEPSAEALAEIHAQAVKDECGRRITEIADRNTQINLASHEAAGKLSDADSDTFSEFLDWLDSEVSTCRDAIENGTDFDQIEWPDPSEAVADLAGRF